MPKFNVYGKIVGTRLLGTYEAETAQAAVEQAEADKKARWLPSLCWQCTAEVGELLVEEPFAEETP